MQIVNVSSRETCEMYVPTASVLGTFLPGFCAVQGDSVGISGISNPAMRTGHLLLVDGVGTLFLNLWL
jgi:hypothetical protein